MENFSTNQPNTNFNFNSGSNTPQIDIPNSNGAFVLGIISLVLCTVLCCCGGYLAGLITSIIGLILGMNAQKAYQANPSGYTEKSFKKLTPAKIMNIVALILSILFLIWGIYSYATGNTDMQIEEFRRRLEEMR